MRMLSRNSLGYLPFPRSLLLKHTLRTMHRMMQASGTSEGLRGLIDLALPKSIKKIIEHRGLFGPAIFALGRIMFFVNNLK
jgi:E3 ubiquitin-protein ligase HUWE1